MIYLYDETGSPIGIKYRSALDAAGTYSLFFFEKNLQGDVVAIYNEAGTKIATYTYDAWGNTTKTRPAGVTYSTADTYIYNNNPFTYRGYYYDSQTGLYYLQSRYYDPSIGSFLNPDPNMDFSLFDFAAGIIGSNVYTYCANNPVAYCDHTGRSITLTIGSITIGIKGMIAIFGAFAATTTVVTYATNSSFRDSFNSAISSAVGALGERLRSVDESYEQYIAVAMLIGTIIAKGIADSFERATSKPSYKTSYELHHIVAKGSKKAWLAQAVLEEVGICRQTDSRNLVMLKTGLHRRLHTDIYYNWVNAIIFKAYISANGDQDKQISNVNAALAALKIFLQDLDKKTPY